MKKKPLTGWADYRNGYGFFSAVTPGGIRPGFGMA
jgi:hypothetical protein